MDWDEEANALTSEESSESDGSDEIEDDSKSSDDDRSDGGSPDDKRDTMCEENMDDQD